MYSQSRHTVLITRPEPQASRFAQDLHLRYGEKVRAVIAPLLAVESFSPPLPEGDFRSAIFTSESGVRAVRGRTDLPKHAFCVGARTAKVAQDHGFTTEAAEGDAPSLLRLLLTRGQDAPFLHLHGQAVTGDISGDLRKAGLDAEGVIVYAQNPLPLSSEAQALLMGNNPVIVPLFSPRSARLFRENIRLLPQLAPLRLVALSPAVAAALAGVDAAEILTAATPDQAELLINMDRFVLSA